MDDTIVPYHICGGKETVGCHVQSAGGQELTPQNSGLFQSA